jgi:hypothetical protein
MERLFSVAALHDFRGLVDGDLAMLTVGSRESRTLVES